jgi:hypothetical protein
MTQTMNTSTKRTYGLKPETLQTIRRYFKRHPDASDYECSRDLKKSYWTIKKYRKHINGGV